MKLSEYKSEYQDFSAKASDRARVASFAGIAIIWLFKKVDASGEIHIDVDLLWPLVMFVSAIVSDLFQYISGYGIWYFVYRYNEKKLTKNNEDPDLVHSPNLAKPIHILFILKLLFATIGYVFLIKHIATWF